jgi:hypothetical protein
MTLYEQIIYLFVLATPVACIAWTVTHEEVFREPREYCINASIQRKTMLARKFFYLFTCEYCFSHYIVLFILFLTGYKLLLEDWRGYVISFFSLVWVANGYMSLFALLRMKIKSTGTEVNLMKEEIEHL